MKRSHHVQPGQGLTNLRGMNHGRVKHGVLGQKIIQAGYIPAFNRKFPRFPA